VVGALKMDNPDSWEMLVSLDKERLRRRMQVKHDVEVRGLDFIRFS
jgi:hypothetical protein